MNTELLKFLEQIPQLSEADRKNIIEKIKIEEFKKGSVLLKEGMVSRFCYYILKGCIRQYLIKDGVEKTTAIYTEGDVVVSFSSYSNQEPTAHNLSCIEDCVLSVGTPESEAAMYAQYPQLAAFASQETSKAHGVLQDELFDFMTSSPEERYLNLLSEKPGLLNRVPLQYIASYIGITPESLSRLRKRLSQRT